jgi:hypothetical protein
MKKFETFKIASVTLSLLVIGWTLSQPFRDASITTRSDAKPASTPIDPVSQMVHRSGDADEFRDEAIALDREFMAELRSKREADQRRFRPGDREVKEQWEDQSQRIQTEIQQIQDAAPGSLEHQRRQSLEAMLEDAPV